MAFGAAVRDLERVFSTGTVTGLTEGQLLDRFVNRGDEGAFEALVTRHGPMVHGVCRRILRDPNDVEDAFQATFLVLVRKAGTLRHTDLLGNWLYGVASKVACKARALAARRRTLEFSGTEAQPAIKGNLPSDESLTLHEELRRLPEKYRAAVVLCYLEGLTHEQAAERLEWPVGTVKGRLARARELLKSRLARRGISLATSFAVVDLLHQNAQASVPTKLIYSTLKAAALVAAGKPLITGVVSAQAILLTEGVLTTMSLTKIKLATMTLALVGTLCTSAGVFAYQDAGAAPGAAAKIAVQTPIETQKPAGNAPDPVQPSVPAGTPAPAQDQPKVADQSKKKAAISPPAFNGGGGFDGGEGGKDEQAERLRLDQIRSLIAASVPRLAEIDKSPATLAILKKLDMVLAMHFPKDTPLEDVLKYIKTGTAADKDDGVRIYVDPRGLADVDVTLGSHVMMDIQGIPVKTSLRLLLKQIGLAYCVKEGLIFISSPEGVLDELREFEFANVPPEQRVIGLPQPNGGGMGGGGMGGGGMGGGGMM